MRNRPYTVASFFCGLGGLDLGFENQGFQIDWANDICENAVKSYETNFGRNAVCEDVGVLSSNDIPNVDVMIGGPPCQSFSLVGKRSEDDPRGRLVFRFADLILAKMPKAFVIENVTGLAASRVGKQRLPDYLSDTFASAGYYVSLFKLNSADFIVPQRRRRLFLVGCLNKHAEQPSPKLFAKEVFGLEQSMFDVSVAAALDDLGPCVPKGKVATYRCRPHSEFASLMRSKNGNSVTLHECPRMSTTDSEYVKHIPPGGNYMDIPDAIATQRVLNFKKTGGRTTTYGRLHPTQPAYTINTYFRRPNVGCHFHYSEPRLITPREAMRLQAFPDHFEVCYSSQDERNAYIGNAVPSHLGQAIAWSLRSALDGERTTKQRKMKLFSSQNFRDELGP